MHFHPAWSFWVASTRATCSSILLMPWCDAGGGLFYNSNTVGSGDVSPLCFLQFPLQLPSGFSILKCLFQHSRLNCFFLGVGQRTQGALCFLRSNWGNHSSATILLLSAVFNCKIKTSVTTMLLLNPLNFFISKIIHVAYTYTAEDVWTVITGEGGGSGDITKPTALIASYTPTTISVI